MRTEQCLTEQELSDFDLGKLTTDRHDLIEGHLDECPDCAARFEQLDQSGDLVVGKLRTSLPEEILSDDSELQRLMAAAAALHETDAAARATTDTENGRRRPQKQSTEELVSQLLSPAQQEDELGRLGDYRVLKVIGRGGMGIVFEAEDETLKRRVALKVMLPSATTSEAAGERFLREARALAAVHNDHVVTIFHVGRESDVPVIAMQLLKGESLKDRLQQQGNVSHEEACRIATEVARGLAAVHAAGLTHRDIKPDNIWLEADTDRVKLLDFGLAHDPDEQQSLTVDGMIVGTPRYLSPEQARGEDVDARSDLFSLGVVLYEMLTGQKPFDRRTALATLKAIDSDTPTPLKELDDRISRDVSDLVMQLLQKEAAQRVQSADELIELLSGWSEDSASDVQEAIQTHSSPVSEVAAEHSTPETSSSFGPPPRQHRVMLAAAGGLFLLLAAVVVYIQTDKGTIIVRAGDGFEVTSDEQVVTVRDTETDRTYKVVIDEPASLPSGGYEIRVTDNEGLEFTTTQFTVTRGTSKLEVTLAAPETIAADVRDARPRGVTAELAPMGPLAMVQKPTQLMTSDGEEVSSHTLETLPIMGTATAAVSPDGKHVATFSNDGMIRIWDARSRRLVQMLIGHSAGPQRQQGPGYVFDAIDSLSWHPDGRRLASLDASTELRIWDTMTGVTLAMFSPENAKIDRYRWSPDGSKLAAFCDDSSVRVLDDKCDVISKLKHEPSSGKFRYLAWSPDGTRLATRHAGEPFFYLWDVRTAKASQVKCPSADESYVHDVLVWSPDGQQIAFVCSGQVVVCEVATGEVRTVLEEAVDTITWSRDGAELFAGLQTGTGADDSVQIVRIRPGQKTHRIELFKNPHAGRWVVSSITPLQDGKQLLVKLLKNGGYLLNVETEEVRAFHEPYNFLDASADGSVLAVSHQREPRVRVMTDPMKDDSPQWLDLPVQFQPIRRVACSPGGKYLAFLTRTAIIVADRVTGRQMRRIATHTSYENGMQFSPDDRSVLVFERDGKCKVWSVETGDETVGFQAGMPHIHGAGAASYSPDGTEIVIVGSKSISVHAASDGSLKRSWDLDGWYYDVSWSPDGRWLAAADNRIPDASNFGPYHLRIYDAKTGEERATFSEFPESGGTGLRHLTFSPDGSYLAGTADFGRPGKEPDPKWLNQLVVWDTSTWKMVFTRPVSAIALRFDDHSTLVYTTRDGRIVAENVVTGEELRSVQTGMGNTLTQLTPDGRQVLHLNGDRISVWNLKDGSLQATILPQLGSTIHDTTGWAAISPDGHYIGSDDAHKNLRHVIRTKSGTRILTPFEFRIEFDWTNEPAKAGLKETVAAK